MIYIILGGRDCDCVQYEEALSFKSRKELDEWIEKQDEYADGPWGFEEVTKKEYDEHESWQRDLAAEQMGY